MKVLVQILLMSVIPVESRYVGFRSMLKERITKKWKRSIDMWFFQMLIPILTMIVGFCLGIMAEGSFKSDNRMDKLERKLRRLEKRVGE